MPQSHPPRRRPTAIVVLAFLMVLGALPLAGCGSSGGNENADPAKIAPAGSLLYFRADIRPEGSQKAGVEALAKKIFKVSDPGEQLTAYLDKRAKASDPKFSYTDDVKPWLGRKAAVSVTALGQSVASGQPTRFVAIVASKDNGKAKDFVDKVQKGASHSYQGSDYRVDTTDRSAVGMVDDFVVAGGTEADFKGVVDAAKGDSLADSDRYQRLAAKGDGKVAFAYVDPKGLAAGLGALGGSSGQALSQLFAGVSREPVTATVDAGPKALTIDASAKTTGVASARTTPLTLTLPGDAWAAVGAPRVGQSFKRVLDQFSTGLAGGFIRTFEDQLRRQTGIDVNRDLLAAIGDVAFFARGTSPLTVGAALVVQSPDPAAARRLVSRVARLVQRSGARTGVRVRPVTVGGGKGVTVRTRSLPGAINAVVKGDRLVIGYGNPATEAALRSSTKLADSPAFKSSAVSLGGAQPVMFVAFDAVSQLLGASSQTANTQKVQSYLEGLSTLAVSARTEGGRQVARIVISVK